MLVRVGKIRVGKSIPHNRSLTKTFLSNGREVAFGLEFEFGSCLKFADTRMLATCLVLYQKRYSFPGIKRNLLKRALLFGVRKYHCNSPSDKDFGWINENYLERCLQFSTAVVGNQELWKRRRVSIIRWNCGALIHTYVKRIDRDLTAFNRALEKSSVRSSVELPLGIDR